VNGKKLKAIREKRGLSQGELGALIGSNVHQIYRYENGVNDPTSEMLGRIARILKVSVDYLLDLSDDPKSEDTMPELTKVERKVLDALRRGDKLEAIRAIVEAP
jgi:transcriptional regulator with XRE-family HTH domain